MGFSYLDDLYWIDITREERYFCAIAYNYFSKEPVNAIQFINDEAKLEFGDEVINQEWEIGYEVALYRDFFKPLVNNLKEDEDKEYGPRKRTFDLCCFSEAAIVIIEAKAHGGFVTTQLKSFKFDREYLPSFIGRNIIIKIVPLISSIYKPRKTTLDYFDCSPCSPLTWHALEEKYEDRRFKIADEAYRKKAKNWQERRL